MSKWHLKVTFPWVYSICLMIPSWDNKFVLSSTAWLYYILNLNLLVPNYYQWIYQWLTLSVFQWSYSRNRPRARREKSFESKLVERYETIDLIVVFIFTHTYRTWLLPCGGFSRPMKWKEHNGRTTFLKESWLARSKPVGLFPVLPRSWLPGSILTTEYSEWVFNLGSPDLKALVP